MRASLRGAGLVLWFLAVLPLHLTAKAVTGRSRWPRRFLAGATRIAGVRVRIEGGQIERPTLLVANHVSWIDILSLASVTGCAFVSKDALGHPLVHWLADQNGTIYVNRGARRAIGEQTAGIVDALDSGKIVALFPEGTVGPGDRLLPFRPPLFTAATAARSAVAVRPVAIDYGRDAIDIRWFGEAGGVNARRVLGRRGRIEVVIRLLDPIEHGDRKAMAAAAETAIANALGFKSAVHSPIDGGE